MSWVYKAAADFVVLVHLGWILFLIFGAVLGWKFKWARWIHLGGLAFSIGLQIGSGICPLTYLEVWLRERHDPALAYPGSFIAHYAEKIVYLQVDPGILMTLTVGLILGNLIIYAFILRREFKTR